MTASGAVCTGRIRVDGRLRIGLTGSPVVAAAGEFSTDALRDRRAFGGLSADVSALSAKAVGWFVLTARRRRTTAAMLFDAELDFARGGKLEVSELGARRGFRGPFVADWCVSELALVVRCGIAAVHYALMAALAMTRLTERIPRTCPGPDIGLSAARSNQAKFVSDCATVVLTSARS